MESNADESDHKTAEETKESRRMRTVDLKKKSVRLEHIQNCEGWSLGKII